MGYIQEKQRRLQLQRIRERASNVVLTLSGSLIAVLFLSSAFYTQVAAQQEKMLLHSMVLTNELLIDNNELLGMLKTQ